MATMIDRIADEISDAHLGDGVTLKVALAPWLVSPTRPPPANDPVAAAIRIIVREVLLSAREPTNDVVFAGMEEMVGGSAFGVWEAMIDAALAEGE